jgi:hypothetical protein
MGITPGRTEAERKVFEEIVKSLDDRIALKMLREETTLLVMMVRVDNEERRAEYLDRLKSEEEEQNA